MFIVFVNIGKIGITKNISSAPNLKQAHNAKLKPHKANIRLILPVYLIGVLLEIIKLLQIAKLKIKRIVLQTTTNHKSK